MQNVSNSFIGFWIAFVKQFGANLAPTWHPKPSQNEAKLVQKSIQNCFKFVIDLLIEFWTIFDWISIDLWLSVEEF